MIWHSYYSQGQIPHATADKGSFWWKDLLHLCDKFRGIATCTVGNGSTVLFWLDVWNGFFLQEKLPRLFTFAKNQKIPVAAFLSTPDMSTLFHLPLSEQAYQEFQELQEIIQSVQMTQTDKDQWHYIWGSSKYTSKSFYNHLYKDFHPPKPFLWIWKSRCRNKLRVFSWLLLMDRLNTRSLLKRKKNSRLMAITTIVSYVQLKEKKLPSTSFSLALLQPHAGSRLEFNGNMEILSSKC